MATNAQIEANRLNALKSTGPRSVEGKAVSRFNALKFGLEARSRVIPGEDPEQLEILSRAYYEHLQPANPLECFMVDSIVAADWNRRRFSRIEAQLYHLMMAALDPQDPAAAAGLALGAAFRNDSVGARALQSVFRQFDSAERSLFRCLKELRALQLDRAASEAAFEMAEPRPAPARPEPVVRPDPLRPDPLRPPAPEINLAHRTGRPESAPYQPKYDFGFVLPKPWTAADGVHFVDPLPGTPSKRR